MPRSKLGHVVAVARALEHRAVEGKREIGHELLAQPLARLIRLGGHRARHRGDDVEALEIPARSLAPLADGRHHHFADVVGVAEPEHHAVADLARQPQHPGGEAGQVDRQVGPRFVAHEVEAGGEALAARRVLSRAGSPGRFGRTRASRRPACRSCRRTSPPPPAGGRPRARSPPGPRRTRRAWRRTGRWPPGCVSRSAGRRCRGGCARSGRRTPSAWSPSRGRRCGSRRPTRSPAARPARRAGSRSPASARQR